MTAQHNGDQSTPPQPWQGTWSSSAGSTASSGFTGSYQGLGVFSTGGPQEPQQRKRSPKWWLIGLVIALLIGGGTATWLTLGETEKQALPSETSTSTTEPALPQSNSTSVSPMRVTPIECTSDNDQWQCTGIDELAYTYEIPRAWQPQLHRFVRLEKADNTKLIGMSEFGIYNCGGKQYSRGVTAGLVVDQADLVQVANKFANAVSDKFYSFASKTTIELSEPKTKKIPFTRKDGTGIEIEGVQVDATITTEGDSCIASKGMVKVLALKGKQGVHVFIANGDLAGGPDQYPRVSEETLQTIVDSVRPVD